ncbi:terpene synthase family protein [Kitasatospora sp. NBC_01287]|uniref:terpene synthase family protein n=1 Tax=Kitasatospora sp. NBC_01287 TaxID=2903573 RepID=UPI00225485FF|nr:terpene synthase family protein [Kitasatospora sp. NBC_01287]MCX4746218.1 terpene synthase family protein [Kitasatospora sp. NBC_01287]
MAAADTRRPVLRSGALTFLRRYGLHPDPEGFLAHGYVDLFLEAWRGSTGRPLELATWWGLWTWRTDDLLDRELREADAATVRYLVMRLREVLDGDTAELVEDHPAVRALADLVRWTRPAMPGDWWDRYASELEAWIQAATEKRQGFARVSRTPTLRQYLTLRPTDGGMLLAAMWTELALGCVTPQWRGLWMHRLLDAFSACGTLANDLAADDDDRFTAQAALVAAGVPEAEALERVREQLSGERARLWILMTAIRQDAELGGPDAAFPVTAELARALDHFVRALAEWTRTSTRYRPPDGLCARRGARRRLR